MPHSTILLPSERGGGGGGGGGGGNTDDWTDPPHSRAKVDSSKFNAHSFHNGSGAVMT